MDDLGERIIGLAGRSSAATCRWLLLVADFDARQGYAKWGFGTTAQWVAHYCGLSRRTAIERVRVARALADHPGLAEEMGAGRLSYSHVRAISRVAGIAEPGLVDDLVMLAEHGSVGQLEAAVRGLRTVDTLARPAAPSGESLSQGWGEDSRWRCAARLDPENGELVRAALAAVGEREGLGQAAALTRIAEIALAVLADADGELPALRGDERAAVVIHLHSAGRAADGAAEPVRSAERQEEAVRRSARIADGPGLPDPVVRRLTCGARVRSVVHGPDQTVIDVGRSRRLVTARQFRALLLRDGGCAHPGCGSRRKLAAHHVRHWVEGGPTDLANVVLLCCAHHHAHHEGEYTITPLGRGRFAFTRADGRDLYPASDPAGVSAEPGPAGRDYDHVRADAATTRWDGTRMDHRYAIAVLAQRLRAPAAA